MRKRKFDEVISERGNIRELSGDEEQKMGRFGRFLPKTQIGCTGVKPVQPICVFAEEVSSGLQTNRIVLIIRDEFFLLTELLTALEKAGSS